MGIAAATLLALYGVMSWTASLTKGLSFDEGVQLAIGYHIWLHDDFRVEGANGDFIKRWATLPYLITRPRFPDVADPLVRNLDSYELGHRFLFESGNSPEALLWQARAMVALLGIVTGYLVFRQARRLFGPAGGLISLTAFAFSPHMLAFGGIVSTDMSITLALFGSTLCIWELLHVVTLARLISSLAFVGMLLLAKMTAVVIVPITAVLVLVRLVGGAPMHVRGLRRRATLISRAHQLLAIAAMIVVHGVVAWTAIWANYGFRFAASPDPQQLPLHAAAPSYRDGTPGVFAAAVEWSQAHRLLPEGYCRGVEWIMGDDDRRPAFMAGESILGGWRMFFPYAIWVKSRPTLFLMLALGICLACSSLMPLRGTGRQKRIVFYHITPHVVLIVVYMITVIARDLNIGHRHVLPIYPAIYVLAGMTGWAWRRRGLGFMVATVAILAWGIFESVRVRPHYLAYFGLQAGGPENGYQHLVDSSLDWGMNLPELKQWLAEHDSEGRERVFLAYFGNDDPDYHGIRAERLPGFYDRRPQKPYSLTPGYYVISATLFQGVYLAAFGRWNEVYEKLYRSKLKYVELFSSAEHDPTLRAELLKLRPMEFWRAQYATYDHLRFARLCAWLRHQGPPPYHVGYALFIWKLNEAMLRQALDEPPVESVEAPREWRELVAGKP